MRDFTVKKYIKLLKSLLESSFSFQTYNDYLTSMKSRSIILRHDVDLLPQNSLRFAQIQHELGIKGTYYFRAVPESWDENIIKKIHDMGHEIGYHYECLTTTQGNIELAIKDFEMNLKRLRELVPVNTICMHGSPRSPYDSKDLWKKYSYKNFGILGEPYFDTDFSQVLYLTDTGRRWNGDKVSVRDKVNSNSSQLNLSSKFNFRHTNEIILAAKESKLPEQILFTFHPQRWTDKLFPWFKELVWQNVKNIVKKNIVKKQNNS